MGNEHQQPQQPARQIANANVGITNIIEKKVIDEQLGKTFDRIKSILEQHCGPYGSFAALADPHVPNSEPVFTRDGINIVRATEFVSTMEELVKRLVMFVGSKIEASSGDGTTSAMIMTCEVLSRMSKYLKDKTFSYTDLVEEYALFSARFEDTYRSKVRTVKDCLDEVNDGVSEADHKTFADVVRTVAFNQAYSSSHGDLEISHAIADMFAMLPPEAWEYAFYVRSNFESETRIEVVTDTHQFTAEAAIVNRAMCNDGLGLDYNAGDVSLMILRSNFMDQDPLSKKAFDIIQHHYTEGLPLVVVAPSGMDTVSTMRLADMAAVANNHCVAIFTIHTTNVMVSDLMALLMILNKEHAELFGDDPVMVEHVQVQFKDGQIRLDNLYPNPTGSLIHPAVNDKTHPMHSMLNGRMGAVSATLKRIMENEHTRAAQADIATLRKMHSRLLLTKRVYLKIGGGQHENTALIDIVADAMLATPRALKEGFVLGGNKTMLDALDDMYPEGNYNYLSSSYDKPSPLQVAFRDAFRAAIISLHKCTYKDYKFKHGISCWFDWFVSASNGPYTVDNCTDIHYKSYNVLAGRNEGDRHGYSIDDMIDTDAEDLGHAEAVIIQPASIDPTVVVRFGEVALKFLATSKIILSDCAYVESKSKR